MAPIVAATPWSEPGHELLAQFRVRTLHTNNQVNPGQRASKRFRHFWSHLKGLYGGLHFTLALLLYYLRRRSPGPPFPPDHRQAGERGAITPCRLCVL
jgi:hypothetical protein